MATEGIPESATPEVNMLIVHVLDSRSTFIYEEGRFWHGICSKRHIAS